ncbi:MULTISPECIES: hypothetical protein [unclassified Cryobacterium]|nr:hypothetical protein [Cryobacterium sp. CAN_C3]
MANSVREIGFRESSSGGTWTLEGTKSGVFCEIEYIGFWLVSLTPGDVTVEVLEGDPKLRDFFESFDVRPVLLVISRIGRHETGWWLRFGRGQEFGERTDIDRFIEKRSTYHEDVYEIRAGATLPSVE